MGMLKWLLGYQAAKHLLNSARPQPVDIRIRIESVDDDDGDEEDCREDRHAVPGDGIYVRDDGVHPPRYFNRDGEETDENGYLL